jgi:hypothetical protein
MNSLSPFTRRRAATGELIVKAYDSEFFEGFEGACSLVFWAFGVLVGWCVCSFGAFLIPVTTTCMQGELPNEDSLLAPNVVRYTVRLYEALPCKQHLEHVYFYNPRL